jgi:NAD(P)H dehydrogenase (quinone)
VTIAVTAASGRLGHATLRHLVSARPPGGVIGIARDPSRLKVEAVERRAGDYGSLASMTTALAGVTTAVMISAPVVSGTDRVALHRNVLAAARAAGVRWVLFTSVVGQPELMAPNFRPTQQANWQAEEDLRNSGLEWTVLRNGLYLDLDLRHIIAAHRGTGVYANPARDGRAPYITIDELGYGTAHAALANGLAGQTLNLTAGCLGQAELVALACEVLGLEVRYEHMSDEDCIARFERLMPERGPEVARMLTGCFQSMRAGAFEVPSHFAAAAGRPPRTMREMLADCRDLLTA